MRVKCSPRMRVEDARDSGTPILRVDWKGGMLVPAATARVGRVDGCSQLGLLQSILYLIAAGPASSNPSIT
jgi:hypothetical protein